MDLYTASEHLHVSDHFAMLTSRFMLKHSQISIISIM